MLLPVGRQSVCMEIQTVQEPSDKKRRRGKGKGDAYPQTGFSATENSCLEGHGPSWESGDGYSNCCDDSSTSVWYNSSFAAWMASVSLDLAHHPTHVGCSGSWLHTINWIKKGNQKIPENVRCIMVLQQNSVFAISLLCLPTLRPKLVGNVVLCIFRQSHHVLPALMCLRRATYLSYSPFRRCRIWVSHFIWIQKELRLQVQLLACTLLPTNIPLWDTFCWILTSLAYQPKSRERSDRPTKRVTLALSQRK